ncbi:ABC transporter ATP-binding protein [Robiginitalea sp.]|uniref:ABC transporter ATP-binding protein n=1 Tax=Robiginitalea sp. TaxID=1902411 RepID=UPI003C3E6505
MIELNKVGFQYSGNDPLIREITFTLERGGILGLLGHNGSGKSTLMKLIGGLLRPKSGTIRIMDIPLDALSRKTLYKSMSMMIEEPSLYGHLSVWDNLRIRSLYHQTDLDKITPVLQQVGMYEFRDRRTAKLSTGMKQRVGLAAALLSDPEILLLDEPTNGMDPQGIIEIRQMIKDLSKAGKTIIVSSHLLSEIEKTARQVMILKNGENVFFGSIENLQGHRDLESFYLNYA